MKNPFPGMNPYLELYWLDIHTRLMMYICDAIQPRLPQGLLARVQEGVNIDVDDGNPSHPRMYPDARIVEPTTATGSAKSGGTATATQEIASTEPIVILAGDLPPSRHIEILDIGSGYRVVTAIEVLSVTNKRPHRGFEKYIAKQRRYMDSWINLVEIDLIRAGEYALAVPQEDIPPGKRATYMVCVWRAAQYGRFEIYPVNLRDSLPTIRIPLRQTDRDTTLDVQAMIDLCCERGAYGPSDYRRKLDPPLTDDDARWAEDLLRKNGLLVET
jgi:hypothetical protein